MNNSRQSSEVQAQATLDTKVEHETPSHSYEQTMVSFLPTIESENSAARTIGPSAVVEIVSSGPVLHIKVAGNSSVMSHSAVAVAVAVDSQVRQYGRVCVLFEIHDRDGCKAIALWQNKAGNFKVQSMNHAKLDEAMIWLRRRVACRGNDSRMKEL